eukprot:TRINITY_DN2457_c0_g1_i7.p1 TRINITY_DN2457_c0_g1~~TRINITY_DN2457_c0_g1_i7.p1  ORF type:complete len:376 (-),score=58.77 TRINITY_DN2457_c0_g1_i7:48-1124(-)
MKDYHAILYAFQQSLYFSTFITVLITYYLIKNKKRFHHHLQSSKFVLEDRLFPNKTIQKAKKKLARRVRGLVVGRSSIHKIGSQIKRDSGNIMQSNVYERTGLFEDDFEEIFEMVKDDIVQPRYVRSKPSNSHKATPTSLSPRMRLLLVLHWLHDYPKYKLLKQIYHISKAQISREIHHILPILYHRLDFIHWPTKWEKHPFEGVSGIIDCTSHFRNRVHPRQADFYRGDKRRHFITAQNVVDFNGVFLNCVFGNGHNNDMNMFKYTHMDEFLAERDIKLLADQGYRHHRIVRPDYDCSQSWNAKQADLRSLGEVSQGMVKMWNFAADRVRENPEIQDLGLNVCYQLTNYVLQKYPIR